MIIVVTMKCWTEISSQTGHFRPKLLHERTDSQEWESFSKKKSPACLQTFMSFSSFSFHLDSIYCNPFNHLTKHQLVQEVTAAQKNKPEEMMLDFTHWIKSKFAILQKQVYGLDIYQMLRYVECKGLYTFRTKHEILT